MKSYKCGINNKRCYKRLQYTDNGSLLSYVLEL